MLSPVGVVVLVDAVVAVALAAFTIRVRVDWSYSINSSSVIRETLKKSGC
jgi:hypothetical protein